MADIYEKNNLFVSNPYEVDPDRVKYDPKIAKFNPPKTEEEYTALYNDIKANGQIEPAFVRNGLIGDGVHRASIATRLDRKLLCIDVNPNMSDEDYIRLCNKNTFSSRNDTVAQKAIKGLVLVEEFGYTDAEARQIVALPKNNKSIGFARTIKASPLDKKYRILETLREGRAVDIAGSFTRSIDTAYRLVKKLEEKSMFEAVLAQKKEPTIDYNSMIDTETAREVFWSIVNEPDTAARNMKLIKELNALYKTSNPSVGQAKGD